MPLCWVRSVGGSLGGRAPLCLRLQSLRVTLCSGPCGGRQSELPPCLPSLLVPCTSSGDAEGCFLSGLSVPVTPLSLSCSLSEHLQVPLSPVAAEAEVPVCVSGVVPWLGATSLLRVAVSGSSACRLDAYPWSRPAPHFSKAGAPPSPHDSGVRCPTLRVHPEGLRRARAVKPCFQRCIRP